jgi:hypothetical protein
MSSALPTEVETARTRVGIGFKEVVNAQGTIACTLTSFVALLRLMY